jgi:hypothetical protein
MIEMDGQKISGSLGIAAAAPPIEEVEEGSRVGTTGEGDDQGFAGTGAACLEGEVAKCLEEID